MISQHNIQQYSTSSGLQQQQNQRRNKKKKIGRDLEPAIIMCNSNVLAAF